MNLLTKRDFATGEAIELAQVGYSPARRQRWTISHNALAPIAIACDAIVILAMSVLSDLAYQILTIGRAVDLLQYAGLGAIVAALFVTLGKNGKLYSASELLNLKAQARQIAVNWSGIFLFLATVGFAMKAGANFSRGATLLFASTGLAALVVERIVWRIVLADGLAVRKFSGRKIVLMTDQRATADAGIAEALSRHGMEPAHHFVLPIDIADERKCREVIANAIAAIRGSDVEEIVISADAMHWPALSGLLAKLRILPLPVNFVPVGAMADLLKLPSHTIGDTLTIELQRGPRTIVERLVKRSIDIMIASAALICLMPLLILTALAIKLESRGPIIFRQRRSGFNGRHFQIFKFRTMSVLEDGDTVAQAQRDDKRVTRIGCWLRRTSIDELPQLFNVLRGDMSIIGPRPHAIAHDGQFEKLVGKYAFRHHVRPGITGWAQVNGYRGETRTVADIEQRTKLDLWYIDNWTLSLDFRILFMTVIEVLRGENAY